VAKGVELDNRGVGELGKNNSEDAYATAHKKAPRAGDVRGVFEDAESDTCGISGWVKITAKARRAQRVRKIPDELNNTPRRTGGREGYWICLVCLRARSWIPAVSPDG
jgi:hypothetical protein